MAEGYYRELIAILKKHQCTFVREGKGSHEFWESPITDVRFPVAKTVRSKNTANAILKQAGIEKKHHF